MKRILTLTLLLAILIFSVFGCGEDNPLSVSKDASSKAISKEKTAINTYGNTSGNIINGGLVAQEGDWIYYITQDYSDMGSNILYKVKAEGSEKTEIATGNKKYINVVDGWIYYCSHEENLYKMYEDGTEITKLSTERVECVNVVEDWIYYIVSNSGIYKMRTNGTEKTKLIECRYSKINVVDGWIYFEKDGLCKMKTDGSDMSVLSDKCSDFNVVDGWIYVSVDSYDDHEIYKIQTHESNKITLWDNDVDEINVKDGWIYFLSTYNKKSSSNTNLYKMQTDGSKLTLVYEGSVKYINIAGDWVYFIHFDKGVQSYCKIKTDGTDFQEIE